ncbi:MAG: sodium:solute symporter [Mangrovibacterium sp.]
MKITLLIIYGIILLMLGLYSALRIKSPVDYFLAGKRTGTVRISGSLLATILGGSAILGTANLAVRQGWAAAWYLLSASLGLWLLVPLAGKVSRLGRFTLTGMVGRFYGETARQTASVIIPLAWTGVVAAQMVAAARILYSLFALPYAGGVLIAGIVFIGYTLLGGQLSILKTDFLQAFVILAGLSLCAVLLGIRPDIQYSPLKASFPFNPSFSFPDLLILVLTFSSTFVVGPDIYSRIFCAKNERTARNSVILVASILIPFAFLLTAMGIFARDNLPAGQLQGSAALIELIDCYLPEWAVGLMAAALLSAVLSSADTTLLNASMILSELVTPDIDNLKSLQTTRLFIVGTGLVSILVAMKITSIIDMLLMAMAVYSGAFIVPLLAALIGIRVIPSMGMPAMIAGGSIALAGKILTGMYGFSWGNLLIIFAFFINFLLLTGGRTIRTKRTG